jgi:ATP-dependent exoDNAse (exonuclease V) beta subunit
VRSLTPVLAKGLEFDLVVLVDPAAFGDGVEGAVDRYVAMTRATGQLVILTADPGTRACNHRREDRAKRCDGCRECGGDADRAEQA